MTDNERNSKEYNRSVVSSITETSNDSGGTTIFIENIFDEKKVNFTNDENTRVMVGHAIYTANGLYSLIHEKGDMNCALSIEKERNMPLLISLSALACEIYLKAILYNNRLHPGDRIKEHNLKNLLNMLPSSDKEEILIRIPGINEKIGEISDAFMELRYVFEFNILQIDFRIVFDLMNVLHDICAKIETGEIYLLEYNSNTVIINDIGLKRE